MENRIRKIYCPMSETAFYILLSLQQERHGYGIGQRIRELTGNHIIIGPGIMYGTLSKMEKDGLIEQTRVENKRKYYRITGTGKEILHMEKERIRHLYQIVEEDDRHEKNS